MAAVPCRMSLCSAVQSWTDAGWFCLFVLTCRTCPSVLSVCLTTLVWLQALDWFHKRGRSYSDLKPDNIRILMGQQPGTFCHVILPDVGGSVKFKGDSLIGDALLFQGCVWPPAALSCIFK